MSISYSTKWIEDNQDYPTLLNNFIYLFEYVDRFFRSNFVSQPTQLSIFENMAGIRGKYDYITGIKFNMQHMVSTLQMIGYYHELLQLNIRLESVFKWFFEDYLHSEFNAKGFVFSAPSDGTTDLEKCKLMAAEIDSILKQFRLYVNEGCIDRELFQISSEHIKMESIPSFCEKKYIYPKNDVCNSCMYLLFSDQSSITTTKKQDNYNNFLSLLQSETRNIADFEEYQTPDINWLSKNGCIIIEKNGTITLNLEKVGILRDLHYHQVGCIQYLDQYRKTLDAMKGADEISYETSLFSIPEQNYLNYILNKAEFSNGYDLRNKYLHGTHSLLLRDHTEDYVELLKIMILIIIKINEEFWLREKQAIK